MSRALSERGMKSNSIIEQIEVIEHTADIGFRIRAKELKTLFQKAAEVMMSVIVDPKTVRCDDDVKISIEETTLEELFLSWMKEILYQAEKRGMVFSRFNICKDNFSHHQAEKYRIYGKLGGEKIDPLRHEICMEIKAVTRHGFYLGKRGSYWESKIIFDV
jgi:SHS2 domain-containing protein